MVWFLPISAVPIILNAIWCPLHTFIGMNEFGVQAMKQSYINLFKQLYWFILRDLDEWIKITRLIKITFLQPCWKMIFFFLIFFYLLPTTSSSQFFIVIVFISLFLNNTLVFLFHFIFTAVDFLLRMFIWIAQ